MDSGVVLRVEVMDEDDNVIHKELVECRSSAPRAIKAFNSRLINRFTDRFPDAHRIEVTRKENE